MGLNAATLKDTVSEVRSATRIARTEIARLKKGTNGAWKAHLALGKLTEERREELVAAINDGLGLEPNEKKVGDQRLHLYAYASGMPLETAAVYSLSEFDRQLRDAGLTSREMLDLPLTFELDSIPVDQPSTETVERRPGLRQRLANSLTRLGPGLGAVATTSMDRLSRYENGDRNFIVTGAARGFDSATAKKLEGYAEKIGHPAVGIGDHFDLHVHTDQVGNGIGALMLCLRKLGDLFLLLPAQTSLQLDVLVPSVIED